MKKQKEHQKELDDIQHVRSSPFDSDRLARFEFLMEDMKRDLSLLADEMVDLISQADRETKEYYVSLHPEDSELFFNDSTDEHQNETDKPRDGYELER